MRRELQHCKCRRSIAHGMVVLLVGRPVHLQPRQTVLRDTETLQDLYSRDDSEDVQ